VDEGRKRVLGIIAGILVARHLRTTEDLFDTKPSPRTESLVACALFSGQSASCARSIRNVAAAYRESNFSLLEGFFATTYSHASSGKACPLRTPCVHDPKSKVFVRASNISVIC
jgi:hypothetical protein